VVEGLPTGSSSQFLQAQAFRFRARLSARRGEAEPLLAEARETFERLGAIPWLERAGQVADDGREREALTGSS
jgi:hypothetical protein